MSDNEYEMEWGDDEEPAEGNAGGEENNIEIEIENNFYEAESEMKTNKQMALEKFETVILMEESLGKVNFSFNAERHVVTLSMQLGLFDKMVSGLKELLKMSSKVSKNDLTEAINLV